MYCLGIDCLSNVNKNNPQTDKEEKGKKGYAVPQSLTMIKTSVIIITLLVPI